MTEHQRVLAINQTRTKKLLKFSKTLSPKEATLLGMRYLEFKAVSEIAEIYGCSQQYINRLLAGVKTKWLEFN